MPPSLHPRSYPHIVECILQHLEYDDLLTARLVSPCMVEIADKFMAGDELAIMKLGGRLTFTSEHGCLPFFRKAPAIPTLLQVHAMRRTRKVVVYAEVMPSKRMNALLAHIQPGADVTLEHGRNAACNWRLPKIRRLKLRIDPSCNCTDTAKRGPAGRFIHGAQYVCVTLHDRRMSRDDFPWRRRETPTTAARCHVVSALLSPDVKQLRVRTPSLDVVRNTLRLLNGRDAAETLQSHIFLVQWERPPHPAHNPLSPGRFAWHWYRNTRGVLYVRQATEDDFFIPDSTSRATQGLTPADG